MFSNLIGNDAARARSLRMLEARRVPGALLLAGAHGVGKTRFAIEVAKSLNCLAPVGGEACDVCTACKRIARLPGLIEEARDSDAAKSIIWSEHRDVGAVIPAGRFITVQQAREVEREANFRPYEGARRVLIIDAADRLNEAASNALLKTLEEVPPLVHILLVTAQPDLLLRTIRSRCQMIRFAPLGADEIEAHLIRTGARAGAEAKLTARLAQGDLARALTMNADAFRTRRDDALTVLDALGTSPPDRARLLTLAESLADARRKDDYEPSLDALESVIRDVWLVALGADEDSIINHDVRSRLDTFAARFSAPRCAAWLRSIEALRRTLAVNVNRRVATDSLLLSMATEA